jgi:N-acetylmuramoyl-L-alanine amidase
MYIRNRHRSGNENPEPVKEEPTGMTECQAGRVWVLFITTMPSVLVETGFITNLERKKYTHSNDGQDYWLRNL